MTGTTSRDRHTLHLAGDYDRTAAPELARLLAELTVGTGPVVVDLAAVTFADASFLRWLQALHTALGAQHRRLEIRGAPPLLRRLAVATGLDAELTFR